MEHNDNDILMHYGVKRRSGRYPWGSGENPYQHSGDFLARVELLKKNGMSEVDISKEFGMSTTELRAYSAVAKNERRRLQVARAKSLKADGLGASEIGRIMNLNESTVRSLLNTDSEARMNAALNTVDFLKQQVAEKGIIDVGKGVEKEIGISSTKMNEALTILEAEGYHRYGIGVNQATNQSQRTTVMVVAPPDMTYAEAVKNKDNIQSIRDYTALVDKNGNDIFTNTFKYPASIDGSRVKIRYAEDGGIKKDGVIEIRRGVEDLSLGKSNYAQVRILVDGDKYLKGMAMYSDDIPKGVDIVFNTNKTKDVPFEKVLKGIKKTDPDNPFGSYIKADGQSTYIDKNGKEKLSAINKVREEGEWGEWSKNLPSQFLSKQSLQMINKQLNLDYSNRHAEYEEILALNNKTIKRMLLNDFADNCDSAAVHLKAASLPRQKTQVILPIDSLKDNEIYAPNFNTGEKVVLIRYPHGGTFEIPELTVNNNHREAKAILGPLVKDAVGINSNVAERLSGADFDGDTVTVIPVNNRVRVKTTSPLKGLEGFDPKIEYAAPRDKNGNPTCKIMSEDAKGREMGEISNLITDMTLRGAIDSEKARAVRHSMTVIDAPKHELDYKRSYEENGIAELKEKYQGHYNEDGKYSEGASTLISKSKATAYVPKRTGNPNFNPVTGEKTYKAISYVDPKTGKLVEKAAKEAPEFYEKQVRKANGEIVTKTVERTSRSTNMAEVADARKLSSGTVQEEAYASYANKMKALANEARKEAYATGRSHYSPEAKKQYAPEVSSLMAKLNTAELNRPKERRAQILVSSEVNAKIQANPELKNDKDALKKLRNQAIVRARVSVGADGKGSKIEITPNEWKAIQAGAISDSSLTKIIQSSNKDLVKQYATPRSSAALSSANISRARGMAASGNYTLAEIAKALGVSTSTVSKYINS